MMLKKWLLTCNLKNFDIITHFEHSDIAYFKRNRYMTPDDIVYIYVAAPYSEIMFKAKVLERGISASDVDEVFRMSNITDRSYIKVQLLRKFPQGSLPRKELFCHKLGQVVNQQRIRFELEDYISSVEIRLDAEGD